MHFVKWARKNNRKIMVFVVIFSMVSFVIGYTGVQIFFSIFGGGNPVVGTFGDNQKIRGQEFMAAQGELTLLRDLGADRLLLSQGNQGLAGPLLSHLLFPDSPFAGDIAAQLKQAALGGQLPVSVEQVEDFFSDRTQSEITWILMKAEAYKAGYVASDEMARTLLRQILPQMAQGADAAQMINAVIARHNISEDQLVRTFADLLSIMFYTGAVTDSQAVTLNQVQAFIGRGQEKLNAEFARIPAEWFVKADSPVAEAELKAQFETYRNVLPGRFSNDNPYGIGYKLPKRVRLEYMAVLLDDVEKLIDKPTAENMEEFYSRHIEQFTTQTPVDPNKPEGEKLSTISTFADSMPQIRQTLEQERILRLANQLFNDARTMTEAGFSSLKVEEADISQLQAAAGDYTQAATTLSGKHKLTVLSGQTGWLSPVDFGSDSILRGLRLQQGATAVPLSEVVYSIQLDPKKTLRKIGVPTMRLWENIGPLTGGYYSEPEMKYYRLMTMVRVVGIEDETVPATLDVTYSTKGMVILPAQQQEESKTTFSLAKQVAADVRRAKAMEIAKARADSLATKVKELGWEKALPAFNAEYAVQKGDPNVSIEKAQQQIRLSKTDLDMATQRMASNPLSASFIQTRLKADALNNRLYALLPSDAQTTGTIFEVIEAKMSEACYVVKEVTRVPASEKDYLDNKVMTSLRLNTMTAADLALVQLKTKNLFDRMGYKAKENPMPIQEEAPIDLPAPGEGF